MFQTVSWNSMLSASFKMVNLWRKPDWRFDIGRTRASAFISRFGYFLCQFRIHRWFGKTVNLIEKPIGRECILNYNFSNSFAILDVYNNGYTNGGRIRKVRRNRLSSDGESDGFHLEKTDLSSKFSARKHFRDITLNVGLVVMQSALSLSCFVCDWRALFSVETFRKTKRCWSSTKLSDDNKRHFCWYPFSMSGASDGSAIRNVQVEVSSFKLISLSAFCEKHSIFLISVYRSSHMKNLPQTDLLTEPWMDCIPIKSISYLASSYLCLTVNASTRLYPRSPHTRNDYSIFFLQSYLNDIFRSAFFLRYIKKEGIFNLEIFKPFAPHVWLYIAILLLAVGTLLRFVCRWEGSATIHSQSFAQLEMILTFGAFCQQGNMIPVRFPSSRILVFFLFWTSILIYNFYTSTLVSTLIGITPESDVKDLDKLGDSNIPVGLGVSANLRTFIEVPTPLRLV